MEKRQTSPLPIIGTEQFGLTEREVAQALREARDNVQGMKESLSDSNKKLRQFSQKALPNAEEKVQALSASPREVLARVKTFYDRTVALASSGVDEEKLALQLGNEFPDLMNFYGLLRMKTWGYNLGQEITAAAAGRQIKNIRGE